MTIPSFNAYLISTSSNSYNVIKSYIYICISVYMFGVKGCLLLQVHFSPFQSFTLAFKTSSFLDNFHSETTWIQRLLGFRDYFCHQKLEMLFVNRSSLFFVYFGVVRFRSKHLDKFLLLSTRKRILNKL